jgi:DNA-binding PadR family transcriptional regulator
MICHRRSPANSRRCVPLFLAAARDFAYNEGIEGDAMEKILNRSFLGEFEQMVLLAVLRLKDEAYAVPIREQIEERAGRSVARGALYTTLERLEGKGYLRSRLGDPTPERGGRARRYYTVSASGLRALKDSRSALAKLWQGLDSVLGKTP